MGVDDLLGILEAFHYSTLNLFIQGENTAESFVIFLFLSIADKNIMLRVVECFQKIFSLKHYLKELLKLLKTNYFISCFLLL